MLLSYTALRLINLLLIIVQLLGLYPAGRLASLALNSPLSAVAEYTVRSTVRLHRLFPYEEAALVAASTKISSNSISDEAKAFDTFCPLNRTTSVVAQKV